MSPADVPKRGDPPGDRRTPVVARAGFTLLEVLFVTVLALLTLGIAAQSYVFFLERTAAEHAAKIFARDLKLARTAAVQRRQPVVIRFDEPGLGYVVVTDTGSEVIRRSYESGSDTRLSSLDLDVSGDSVVFNPRGVADLSGAASSLAEAKFYAGQTAYTVFFNSLGGSRVEETT